MSNEKKRVNEEPSLEQISDYRKPISNKKLKLILIFMAVLIAVSLFFSFIGKG